MPKIGKVAQVSDPESPGGKLRQARLDVQKHLGTPGKPTMDMMAKLIGCGPSKVFGAEHDSPEPNEDFQQRYMDALQTYVLQQQQPVPPPVVSSKEVSEEPLEEPLYNRIRDEDWRPPSFPSPVDVPQQSLAPHPISAPKQPHQHSFTVPVTLSIDGLLLVKSCDSCPMCYAARRDSTSRPFRHFDEIRVWTGNEEEEERRREEHRASRPGWNATNSRGYEQRGRW